LASLPEVLDLGLMSARLAPVLDRARWRLSSAQVVASSPGKRAVVAYQTAGPAAPGPTLIGKVYADHGRGRGVHHLLEQLWWLEGGHHRCPVPQPLTYLSDLGMSVYLAAPGVPIDRLMASARVPGVVVAARWLADLHGSGLQLDRQLDLAAEIANLATWVEVVAVALPSAGPAARRLLDLVRASGHQLRPVPMVPIHKDYHYQHTLIGPDGAVVIDLDEMRMGDPVFDLAHFTAYLHLLAVRHHGPGGGDDGLGAAFLDAYSGPDQADIDACRFDFYFGYSCLKIAKQLVTGRGPAPVPDGSELVHQLDFMLAEGLACLPR
jgi:hypothetical protein